MLANPQGYAEQLEKDKETFAALGNAAKKAGTWAYRSSPINQILDPADWAAQQADNKESFDALMQKASEMNAEEWGDFTGQVLFEVVLEVGTAGGAAALTTLKVADKTVDAARIINRLDDVTDAARIVENADDVVDGARAIENALPPVPEELGDVVIKAESPVNIGLFKRYIQSIEEATGRKLNPKQIEELKEALRNKKYEKLSKSETAKHRNKFSKTKKDNLIDEWERETGQEWPKYDEDVLDKNGDIYRRAGDPYDAHHIIENNHGGDHEWWNMHPAKSPGEHQGGIHGSGSPSRELFN